MEFTQLTPQEFETLCGRLLNAAGFQIELDSGRSRDIGVDFTLTDSSGVRWLAEIKHYRRPRTGTAILRQASRELNFACGFTGAKKGLLIVSMLLPRELKRELQQQEEVEVWDYRDLNEKLDVSSDIRIEFQALIDARLGAGLGLAPSAPIDPRAQELIDRLKALPPGREHWRQYEELCVEFLNYALLPGLRVPKLQSRSEDGLDIRDAIYPLSRGDTFWQEIRDICKTRFAVAEFKNHSDPIQQREVESVQQYLYIKARRTFGLLCSRMPAADSAIRARRRAWVEHDRLILFLSDSDLIDLVRARSYGERPTDVLDAQLDEFLLALSP